MASQQEIRCRSSGADRDPLDLAHVGNDTATATATTTRLAHSRNVSKASQEIMSPERMTTSTMARSRSGTDESMPPPRTPCQDGSNTRKSRSTSVASRNANRLSLTLPIALPTSDPSRPTPTSAAMPSLPQTPIDSTKSTASQPVEANEFIIAIAAQERRVLELREELARAEAELSSLKKKWTVKDANQKRPDRRPLEAYRPMTPASDDDAIAARRSLELDRRKLLLQGQHSPVSKGRRVLRGGHTRTLSLLSPTKPDPTYSLHGDRDHETIRLPPIERRTAQLMHPNLSKRASWQPHSTMQQQQSTPVVPGIVEDFKLGLRAFFEDIRQITVGDEPINGQAAARSSSNASRDSPNNQDTIRASHQAARPKVSTAFDSPCSVATSPTPSSKTAGTPREKAKPTKSKRFSWTPLGFDALDDDDWSNWESPGPVKTARWSGSTIGSGTDDADSVAESDQPSTPQKKRIPMLDSPLLSPKLEEILPNMVNRLTPGNLKRTAHNLMDEWEKSLHEPEHLHSEHGIGL